MENQKRKLIIVGQEAGGVGKSTVVTFLAEYYLRAEAPLLVLDADDKNRTADGSSALAHMLPSHTVTWLGAGPSLAAIEDNPDCGNAHWDKVRAALDHGDVILDLGANTIQRLIEYAVRMRAAKRWAEDGIAVEVWVPTTADKINAESALKAVTGAGKAFGAAALRVVSNRRDGDFDLLADTPQGEALAKLARAGVVFVDLPKAPVPPDGLKAMKAGSWSPFQVVAMGRKAAADHLGLPGPVAERTVYGCEDWIEAVRESWVEVVPEGNG